MKKIVRLTESDLMRIVRRVINENVEPSKGDTITLRCINPLTNNGKMISPVEYVNYISNADPIPDKLIVQRPSDLPSDEVFSSDQGKGSYTLNIEMVKDEDLKRVLNITDDDTYVMTYNVGGRFYCTPKKPISSTWESFFTENNILS
jgi:hypothetical protein